MARTSRSTTAKPSLMSRLRGRHNAKVTTKESRNPITGTQTVTKKTTTHPKGLGHHGHGGKGPMASNTTTDTTATTGRHHHHQQRHATVGDKVSGAMMKLRGSLTRRPGLKVCFLLDAIMSDQLTLC